jgi:hypothetical protein
LVLVTRREVIIGPDSSLGLNLPKRTFSVVPATAAESEAWQNVRFDGTWLEERYRHYRVIGLVLLGFASAVLVFVWKLVAVLGYALVACGAARLFGKRVAFSAWLNVLARAVTVPTLLQLSALLGLVSPWVLYPGVATLVTGAYAALGAPALCRHQASRVED